MDRELKRLSRAELLEMLLVQTRKVEKLEKELELSKKKQEELEKRLKSRKIQIENAGSIAEAALQINDIFTVAQETADQYLENIKRMEAAMRKKYRSGAVQKKRREASQTDL